MPSVQWSPSVPLWMGCTARLAWGRFLDAQLTKQAEESGVAGWEQRLEAVKKEDCKMRMGCHWVSWN